jgi:hypothetical protein
VAGYVAEHVAENVVRNVADTTPNRARWRRGFVARRAFGLDRLTGSRGDNALKNKPVVSHHARRHNDVHRRETNTPTPPHGPEYGSLQHVPPNAIRMPGYIFVPGVGILGESCDLPISAYSNRYRDIQ